MKSPTKTTTNKKKLKIIAVLGPTASGKTDLSIRLAQTFSGEIVSCDSVQVFRHLDIGSAKPDKHELSLIPHHLIDVFEPDFRLDVGLYKQLAENAISDILNRNQIPILVGGTGMYFNALYYGLFPGPTRSDSIRKEIEEKAKNEGIESLFTELRSVDPESAAKILPNDLRRLVRALEVFRLTGKTITELHAENQKLELDWLIFGMDLDRKRLYNRIEQRVDDMIEKGLIDETRSILERYGDECYALGSIGYRHCADYLNGRMERDEMIALWKRDTRRYAKRQLTWFRKTPHIRWVNPEHTDSIIKTVNEFLEDLQ